MSEVFTLEQQIMDSPLQNLVTSTTRKSNNNDDDTEQIEEIVQAATYKTYKTRFYGLTVIAFLNISSSLNWYIVAPVPDLASTYFNNIGLSAINWFSNVFMLTYLIAGPISSWVYDHLSVKFGVSFVLYQLPFVVSLFWSICLIVNFSPSLDYRWRIFTSDWCMVTVHSNLY